MTNTETQIATDLNLIDLIEALGTPAAKRKARQHRKAIFKHLHETTPAEFANLSDDELLAELGA